MTTNHRLAKNLAGMGALAATVLLTACSATTVAPSPSQSVAASPSATATPAVVHWGYSGDSAPEHWGELSHEFEECAVGTQQSPIDIRAPRPEDLKNLAFAYREVPLEIVNNGHTQQINIPQGLTFTAPDGEYQLAQFHFHTPSEHTIDGQPAAAEVHFVHKNSADKIAVVGAVIKEGTAQEAAYKPVVDNLQKQEGDPVKVGTPLDVASLLPADKLFATYEGSLTTPPCSEGVAWYVLNTPVELSRAQIDALHAVMGENARPVQDLNGRQVDEDSTP